MADAGRRDHSGQPLDEQTDFPVAAPAGIGELRSAHSTLRAGQEPLTAFDRLLNAVLIGALGALIAAGVEHLAGFGGLPREMVFAAASLAGAVLGYSLGRFEHSITYVGRDGIARFRIAGSRDRVVDHEQFLFRQATRLRRLDSGTSEWVDGDGRVVCRLRDEQADGGWCAAARLAWDDARALPDGTPEARARPDQALIVGGIELAQKGFSTVFLVVVNGAALAMPPVCACCCASSDLIEQQVTGSSLRAPLSFSMCRACRWHVRLMPSVILLTAVGIFVAFVVAKLFILVVLAAGRLAMSALVRAGCSGPHGPIEARGRKDGFASKDRNVRATLDEHWMAVGEQGVELKLTSADYVRRLLELNSGNERDLRRLEGPPVG